MIVGLGVDLCSIPRMLRAVRSRHFVERLFRPEEIAYSDAKGNERSRAASYASAFAAREAFCKATGMSMYAIAFSADFCLMRCGGAPYLEFSGSLAERFAASGNERALVSLSHDGDYAVAVVVVEKD